MSECIFCKIVRGEVPCHKIWESETHMAFLSIFPNIKGFSVVIPKKHLSSKVTALSTDEYVALMSAAKEVSLRLDKAFNIDRTAIIAEGMGVNHAHIKLFPLQGTSPDKEWEALSSSINKKFDRYEGYVSSHDSDRADDDELARVAKQIREVE